MVLEQAEKESKRNLGISLSMPDSVNRPSHYQGAFGLEDLKKARKNLDWLIGEMERKSK